jgi:gamma-glutamyltranspeptidase/glutathione hydrolase
MFEELSPRGPHYSLRPPIMTTGGLVVAGSPLASHAGAEILSAGGNVIDAAIAAAAVQAVVVPHLNGPGGDMFMLYRTADGKIKALNASGPAPAGASLSAFEQRGLTTIPIRGIEAATVPGAVDGWFRALRDAGSLSARKVFTRALSYAVEGFPAYANFISYLSTESFKAALKFEPRLGPMFMANGKPPRKGELIRQPELARTLERLISDGPDDFYRGDTARLILAESKRRKGFFEERDLANYKSRWIDPISVRYRNLEVFQVPPNSQGITMLQQLLFLANCDLASLGHNSAQYIDRLVSAKLAAFSDRASLVCDPEFVQVPVTDMLSEGRLRAFAREMQVRTAVAPNTAPSERGDTVSLVAIDRQGNIAVLIQSLSEDFGSAVAITGAGFVLSNRMGGFSLQKGHPNQVAPGKRPLHTLCCGIAVENGHPVLAYATPGGHAQTQTLVQVLNNLVLFGMDIQEAVEAPRFSHEAGHLLLEGRIGSATHVALSQAGHAVHRLPDWSSIAGGCTAIAVDHDSGMRCAGADPRRDAYASASYDQ